MIPKTLATALLVVALPAIADPVADPATDALDEITEASLKAHYSTLAGDAMEGRFAGTAGYQRAADYVAEQFAAIDPERIGVHTHGREPFDALRP